MKDACTDDLSLPDASNTELFVSYTYQDDDGSTKTSTLNLKGENAEHAPFMIARFQAFLERLGYQLGVEPPVTVHKVLKAAMILLFSTGLMQVTHETSWSPRQGRRLSVVADIPMPTLRV